MVGQTFLSARGEPSEPQAISGRRDLFHPSSFRLHPSSCKTPPPVPPNAPHSTKPQYFLAYAVLGSVVPFLSVLLAERGLKREQIGTVWAVSNLAVIFTPLLITLLADTAVAARVLLGGL